ncbi:hypothetical protein [Rufibacter sp. XAAS-G3-1]|uniref:hypothetical protein n=1 Tax=Rufibacter sp. XAAS-G3-1 TaxID=2729134 RepID=UPI0015E79D37|nr:hypothetical protein [Rufibacter sp. XAAS-G3-1]
MERFAKEQVSKEVLEIILDHYTPKLTSQAFNLFGITITYYFPLEDRGGDDFNTVAFSLREDDVDSYYILACQASDVTR